MARKPDDDDDFDPNYLHRLINAFHSNASRDIQKGTGTLHGMIEEEEAKTPDVNTTH